jgi:hypothetical protein
MGPAGTGATGEKRRSSGHNSCLHLEIRIHRLEIKSSFLLGCFPGVLSNECPLKE